MGNLIVKSNSFVGASYGLGVTEQRLVLLAILKARETDSISEAIGKTLTIHASDYMAHFGVDRATAYESLENAVNGLYESEYRFIEILPNGERKTHRERFVSGIAYSDGLGQVELRFTPETVPLVVGLSENFTKYEIEQVSRLSSQYALRLYEMLTQWRAKGKVSMKLDELRFKFGLLDDEYQRMHDFKKRVLDMAVNEINKHTDLAVSYEQHKQGRVITGFTFAIKQKTKSKPKLQEQDSNPIDLLVGKTDQERQIIAQKNAYANQIGATAEHRENLIRQGLITHRQAEQSKQERQQREKAERQAQEQQDKDRLELAQRQFEQILASDELITAYIAKNINPKYLSGLQKIYYDNSDFKNMFSMEKCKFEKIHEHQRLILDFLDF